MILPHQPSSCEWEKNSGSAKWNISVSVEIGSELAPTFLISELPRPLFFEGKSCTSTTLKMTRPYAHRDLVLKIFCQIVSVHNFLLSMLHPVTLPATTVSFFSR